MALSSNAPTPNMSMNQPVETVRVVDRVVACDGGEGALGHPRVFLNMGSAAAIDCPYCGRRFVFAGDPGAPAGH